MRGYGGQCIVQEQRRGKERPETRDHCLSRGSYHEGDLDLGKRIQKSRQDLSFCLAQSCSILAASTGPAAAS